MKSYKANKALYSPEQIRLLELMEILETQTNQRSLSLEKLEQHNRQLQEIVATEKSQLEQAQDWISRGEELCFPIWIDETETDPDSYNNGPISGSQTSTKEGGLN